MGSWGPHSAGMRTSTPEADTENWGRTARKEAEGHPEGSAAPWLPEVPDALGRWRTAPLPPAGMAASEADGPETVAVQAVQALHRASGRPAKVNEHDHSPAVYAVQPPAPGPSEEEEREEGFHLVPCSGPPHRGLQGEGGLRGAGRCLCVPPSLRGECS